MHHASGQDRRREPVRRLPDGGLLALDGGKQFAAVMEVIGARAHRASSLTKMLGLENHEWTRIDTNELARSCPGGTSDNSPSFQRWVGGRVVQGPQGRPNRAA